MTSIQTFRLVSIAGAFLVGFWLPIRMIGFVPPPVLEFAFDLLISMTSAVNLFLYFSGDGGSPRDFRNWLRLEAVLDFICLMPLAFIAFLFLGPDFHFILALNLLTVRHVRHIRPFLDYFDSLQPIVYRLIPLLVTLPLLVHLLACGWIALGSGSFEGAPDHLLVYVKAVYWTFTTLTTVGYGDIVARTIPQMLYACVVQVIGVGVFGYILSNVAGLLARSDAAREHHMNNLDKVETFLKLHQIPPDLRAKIRAYYHYVWINKRGYQDRALLESLPGHIQSQLYLHINRSIIDKVSFLRGADQDLLTELMSELKTQVCVPGESIFKAGDPGEALYFIHSGDVQIIGRGGEIIAQLSEGAFFGEMALISDRPRAANAKASGYCDLYVLSKESFSRVTAAYPSFLEHIQKVMDERRLA
jgi:hypothetical protein